MVNKLDHDRYEVELTILGQTTKMYVAVGKYLPDELIDHIVKNEVFDYLKKSVNFTYSQKNF